MTNCTEKYRDLKHKRNILGRILLEKRWCETQCYPFAESLEWTAEPENPTKVTEGQKVKLTWSYSLTAAEQANSNIYVVKWVKFNSSSLVYTEIASYIIFGGENFNEPNEPHIVVGRPIASDSATLLINDVKRNDEGLYKIEYSLASGKLNESEISLTVLGKFLFLNYDHYSMFVCCTSFHCNQEIHAHVIIIQVHQAAGASVTDSTGYIVCVSTFGGKLRN